MKPFRVGILGGMGPLAGVELHRLIIEATPATVDQDHLQVILFTDPKIPDRTTSLRDDDGQVFAAAAAKSAKVLEDAGTNVIALACMTAHSRLGVIQDAVSVPIVDGVSLVQDVLAHNYSNQTIALLATTGSVSAGVYTNPSRGITWLVPPADVQLELMEGIYAIKAGELRFGTAKVIACVDRLAAAGATTFLLGCTELGLLYDELMALGYTVVDPMRLLAQHVVELSTSTSAQPLTKLAQTGNVKP